MNTLIHRWHLRWVFTDLITMIERNILRYVRLPQLVVFSSIQPVMFLLLFTYVFGGAIRGTGDSYISYLLPGILVQTVIFGAIQTGVGLSEDMAKGLIDRFRSLPMSRSAVLAGRTVTDMLRNIFVILLMVGVGYLIGFRLHGGVADTITALALLLYFGFAFSWISAAIGMLVKNAETAQVAGFIWVFPLVFASSIFVPVETMSEPLRTFAQWNPITVVTTAVRELLGGATAAADLTVHVGEAFIWVAAITLIFMPLAIRLYRRSA